MYNRMRTGSAKKFVILMQIIIISSCTKVLAMLEKHFDLKNAPETIEFRNLHRENCLEVMRKTLIDKEKSQALDKTISDHVKTNPDKGSDTYFYVAAKMRQLVYASECSPEEQNIAGVHAARYFVKALIFGNTTASTLLIFHRPKLQYLINQILNKSVTLDIPILKLLEKEAHDYWVYNRGRTIYYI